MIPDWQNELKERLEGEVYFDATTLGMYATDASAYQIFPKAVVVPRTEEDVIQIHKIAVKHRISLLPRGAGTSLAGQTVGESVVLDFSKYLNRIIEFNEQGKWVRVEPGLIHSELNDFLKPYGLMYAPDPATSTRASIGGILANNSSGSRSIVFGKAIDHIREMRLLSADGEILTFRDIDRATVKEKCLQDDLEGRIYRTLSEVVDRDGVLIREKFPTVMRRVSGYSLDEFLGTDTWNLSKLICGSEGTLGTILEAKLNLVDQPKFRGVSAIHYHNRLQAIAEVKNLLPFGPSAVELLDDRVISIAKTNPSTREMAQFIEGNPAALLIVEFFGDSEASVREKFNRLNTYLMGEGFSYHAPFFMGNERSYNNIWEVRKKGLGLLFSMRGDEKPVTVIEDACVPVESLASYVDDIVGKCNEFGIDVILYAHASVGVLHIRPLMNLRTKEDIRKFRELSEFSLQRVIEYKGSFSGEHGDGLSRSYGIPLFFGDQIYSDFKKIKSLFDPDNRMNPGKIVDAPAMDENLRYGSDFRDQAVKTLYHYRKELGFDKLIHMCNGIGLCHRVSGGVMCPSYKASLDEKDSTRGRANAMRLTLSGQINRGDFTHEDLMEVLDLCISCKSCKTECPSNVDMAKLKSEVLQMHHDKKGISLRGWFIILSDDFSRWFSGPLAGWINGITRSRIFRISLQRLAGIDARRVLDPYARVSLKKWMRRKFVPRATGQRVLLFADTYINYHQVEIGRAIVRLLDNMGFQVELMDTGGSKRPLISNGFLRKAKKRGAKIAERLRTELEKGTPVIVCEPSAYSALTEDIPDLMEDEQLGERMKEHIVSLEYFLAVFAGKQNREKVFDSTQEHHVIHGHCHQKAMEGTAFLSDIFDKATGTYEILDAGCCGMAGAFGFEKEHYDFSKQIFDTDLGRKLDDFPDDQLILASGFSCRHQIDELSVKKVKHWVEVLDYIAQ